MLQHDAMMMMVAAAKMWSVNAGVSVDAVTSCSGLTGRLAETAQEIQHLQL